MMRRIRTRTWLLGGAIALLLGLNVVQASILFTHFARNHIVKSDIAPVTLTDNTLTELTPQAKAVVVARMAQVKPELNARLNEVRDARHDLVHYITSRDYQRDEAEKRFAALRAKSEQAQKVAQDALLDAADRLPAKDRAKVVATIDTEDDGQ